jgi:hypothetical protein
MVEAWIWLKVQLSVCWHAGHPAACRGSRVGITDALATVARRSAEGALKMLKMRMAIIIIDLLRVELEEREKGKKRVCAVRERER